MPLTKSGKRVMAKMRKRYGDHAEEVFYAMISKGASGSGQWHRSPDNYDDTALGETPPRIRFEVQSQSETPKKVGGIPGAVQQADGTENLRADGETKTSTRASAGGGKTHYPAIDRFSGENV